MSVRWKAAQLLSSIELTDDRVTARLRSDFADVLIEHFSSFCRARAREGLIVVVGGDEGGEGGAH